MLAAVLAANPDHRLALYHRALAFVGKRDLDSAAADLTRILARDPNAAGAARNLALIRRQQGNSGTILRG
jgi:predicted Zn-dependent protease